MGRYTIRRILQMIPVVIGTTFIIYAMVWALPGDPFVGKCGDRPCPEAYVAEMRAKFNLDDSLPVQYVKYLWNLLQGDFGESFSGRTVWSEIAQAFPVTFRLALMAILIEILIGISAGVLAALNRGGFLDNLILVSTLIVISIPVFVIGFLAQFTFGIKLGWFPPTVGPNATVYELILPAFVLASASVAYVARLMRGNLAENLHADYVRTATAKGLSRRRVIGRHAVRNSLIPVVTFIGVDFGGLIGGAIVTEGIFNIRGIGGLLYLSIRTREGATVVGVVTVLVLVFLLVNLLVDILYGAIDPRIRYE